MEFFLLMRAGETKERVVTHSPTVDGPRKLLLHDVNHASIVLRSSIRGWTGKKQHIIYRCIAYAVVSL